MLLHSLLRCCAICHELYDLFNVWHETHYIATFHVVARFDTNYMIYVAVTPETYFQLYRGQHEAGSARSSLLLRGLSQTRRYVSFVTRETYYTGTNTRRLARPRRWFCIIWYLSFVERVRGTRYIVQKRTRGVHHDITRFYSLCMSFVKQVRDTRHIIQGRTRGVQHDLVDAVAWDLHHQANQEEDHELLRHWHVGEDACVSQERERESVCVYVCVRVWERERERERQRGTERKRQSERDITDRWERTRAYARRGRERECVWERGRCALVSQEKDKERKKEKSGPGLHVVAPGDKDHSTYYFVIILLFYYSWVESTCVTVVRGTTCAFCGASDSEWLQQRIFLRVECSIKPSSSTMFTSFLHNANFLREEFLMKPRSWVPQ